MLRVRDIMTSEPIALDPQTSLRDAAELFVARHVGGAPVTDAGGKVLGVVSMSDIMSYTAAIVGASPDTEASEEDWDEWSEPEEEGGEVDEPAARFYTDLWTDAPDGVVERIASNERQEPDPLAEHVVGEVMTLRVRFVDPATPVALAAARMRAADVHRLLVMEGEQLVGIITSTDFVRAVAEHRLERRTFVFDRSHVESDHDGAQY